MVGVRHGRLLLNGIVAREHVYAALLWCFQPPWPCRRPHRLPGGK
jgi:hypothetical protein